MMSTTEKFWQIVEEEMRGRDVLSYRALEAAGNVANGTISQRARDLLRPTPTTIDAIATAFNVSSEIVKSWAKGRRPPATTAKADEAHHLFAQLPEGLQDVVLAQMRALVQMQGRGERVRLGTMLATAPGHIVGRRD